MSQMQPPLGSVPDFSAKKPGVLPWIVAGVAAVAALALLFAGLLPAQAERDQAKQELAEVQQQVEQSQAKLKEALKDNESLAQEQDKTKGELKSALEEKEAALKALKEAQTELEGTLQEQITAGDVLIKEEMGSWSWTSPTSCCSTKAKRKSTTRAKSC